MNTSQDFDYTIKYLGGEMNGLNFIQEYSIIGGILTVFFIVFKTTIEQIIKQNNEVVNHLITLNEEIIKSNNKLIETNNKLTEEIRNLREEIRKGA